MRGDISTSEGRIYCVREVRYMSEYKDNQNVTREPVSAVLSENDRKQKESEIIEELYRIFMHK